MTKPVTIAVFGAGGRMGRAVQRIAGESDDFSVVDALSGDDTPAATFDVLIDFSGVSGFDAALAHAREQGVALVSGSTGLTDSQHDAMRTVAATIPLLWSANFSIGIAVLRLLVRDASRRLADFDCEIHEAHHRDKKDAPSGTALVLGRDVADARGIDFDANNALIRDAKHGARRTGEIGFSVTRGGDIVGEHAVQFIGHGERLELIHRATDRDIFARGALHAARWIAAKPAGFYAMDDVLG
ncbi:MAG: 4-hydroxy-tetrahydrodipicolinate reductase [Dokdonella sp.]